MEDSYLDKYISPDGATLYTLQELLNKPILKDKIYIIKTTQNITTDIEALRLFLSYFYEKTHINTYYYDFITPTGKKNETKRSYELYIL